MKIIFLDIDDTLITRRSATAKGWFSRKEGLEYSDLVDPMTVEMLNRLMEIDPATKVVINSAWTVSHGRDEVMSMLRKGGFEGEFHEDWGTPYRNFRGDRIDQWMAKNPGVASYVILDDSCNYYFDQPFVCIEGLNGMMVQEFYKAAEYLYGDKSPWRKDLEHYLKYHPSEHPPGHPRRSDGRHRSQQKVAGSNPT